MRIGIVSEYVRPWPGGISEHVHYEAGGLRARGHSVKVYSGPGHTQPDVERLPYHVCFGSNGARNRLSFGFELARLRAHFERDRLDLLHVHAPLDPLLPLLSALAAPCPVVGTFHASLTPSLGWDLYHRVLGPLSQRALGRMARKIAVSAEAERSLSHYFAVDCVRIPNGVDLQRFAPRPKNRAKDLPRILFVGRPDPRKGLPILLAAFEIVSRHSSATLDLVGVAPRDVPVVHRTHPRIACHGLVEPTQMAQHFENATLVCAPSLHGESQGVVLLEAMAAGKPVVCSDIAGYRELVRHDLEGRRVQKGRVDLLAVELIELLGDPSKCAALGKAARQRAEQFGWERVLDGLEATLDAARSERAKSTESVPASEARPWT